MNIWAFLVLFDFLTLAEKLVSIGERYSIDDAKTLWVG